MPSHLPSLQASISLFPTVIFCCLPFVLFLFFESIMEPQQQQPNQQPPNEDNTSSGGAKGSFLCRQSSTRWTPTTDQIRILKDIYYNTGIRSPNAEQIQRISARLRQYGKIEGKNVFYWFQNHKARERQKKKFATDGPPMQQREVSNAASRRPEDYSIHNRYPSSTPGTSASPSSVSVFATVGQTGNYGYGSVTMEKCFRKCSISSGASSNGAGGGSISYERVGIDPCGSSYNLWNKQIMSPKESPEEGDLEKLDGGEAYAEFETLPLFPVHCENNINAFCNIKPAANNICNYKNWYGSNDGHTSLELSLNSCPGQSPDYV